MIKVSKMKVSLREHCTWLGTGIGNSKQMSLETWPEVGIWLQIKEQQRRKCESSSSSLFIISAVMCSIAKFCSIHYSKEYCCHKGITDLCVNDDDDESMSYVRVRHKPSWAIEHANDMLWWTVHFSDNDRMRMEDGSGVAILEESSTWTVLPQRSCEDCSRLSMLLEQQDHHVPLSVGDGDQLYQRPAGTW